MLRSLALRRGVHVTLVILGLGPGAASAQVVTGTVREDSTGRRLAGVDVIIQGTSRRATTDASGRYVLDQLAPGSYVALFRLLGFAPQRVSLRIGSADTVWANALLVASALPLPPLEVTAKEPRGLGLEGFEERRRLGFGKFIDSTVLRRSEHLRLPDVLRRVQGVIIEGSLNSHVAMSSRRFGLSSSAPKVIFCAMQIIVDGIVVYRSQAPVEAPALTPTGSPMPGANLQTRMGPPKLEEWGIDRLEAIEVYRSAGEVPIEFGGSGAACGTIVLWTKRK